LSPLRISCTVPETGDVINTPGKFLYSATGDPEEIA
ncbi:hypothetical protein CP8484711_0010B, partial [Chlamydia psittaci 84-8471/1]